MYRGKVLMWHREITHDATGCHEHDRTYCFIFDPLSPQNLIRIKTPLPSDIFCGGLSWDPQGRLIVVGGNRAQPQFLNNAYALIPGALGAPQGSGCSLNVPGRYFLQLADMKRSRFYPSIIGLTKETIEYNAAAGYCTSINGGAHLVLGGPYTAVPTYPGVDLLEVLPYGTFAWACSLGAPGWGSATSLIDEYVPQMHPLDPNGTPPTGLLDSYPRALQLSNGDVIVLHDVDTPTPGGVVANPKSEFYVIRFNQAGASKTEFWRGLVNPQQPVFNEDRNYGSAVLLHTSQHKDRMLVFGGSSLGGQPIDSVQEFTPAASATVGGTTVEGRWRDKSSLLIPRDFCDAVVLPDGQILITGGASQFYPSQVPVAEPELYDPDTQPSLPGSSVLMPAGNPACNPPFTPNCTPAGPTQRMYHHFSVLLPDGSVFVAGGEAHGSPIPGFARGSYTGEIFYPAYMPEHTGYDMPYIGSVVSEQEMSSSSQINSFTVTVEECSNDQFTIVGAVLTRPAAVTHFFDNDQRYIELFVSSQSVDGSTVTMTVEAPREKWGPPGYYMLWVIVTKVGHNQRLPTRAEFVRFY